MSGRRPALRGSSTRLPLTSTESLSGVNICMEAALQIVERHCPAELNAYVDCVDANPSSWHATCNQLKQALSVCAAKQ